MLFGLEISKQRFLDISLSCICGITGNGLLGFAVLTALSLISRLLFLFTSNYKRHEILRRKNHRTHGFVLDAAFFDLPSTPVLFLYIFFCF